MRKVKIINNEGLLITTSQENDFKKAGIKVGEEIEVRNFTTNSVAYKSPINGEICLIYTWNFEDVITN